MLTTHDTRPFLVCREIGNLLPNNQRQRRTCYALCHILYPVSAAHTSIFRMDVQTGVLPASQVRPGSREARRVGRELPSRDLPFLRKDHLRFVQGTAASAVLFCKASSVESDSNHNYFAEM